ncbi:hypothetical protein E2C01_074690 [Portunus trituberculatus]|uniref:Uncharacterized protein n=1 Tax=Portunus trituberculatus TaxID=210409 RepID=A0A5B7I8N6_PORTR|nr:hypothetical protein [Portunus trituberculatus]
MAWDTTISTCASFSG